MTESLKSIRRRIKSVSSTERITSAMKMVSVAKMKRATRRFEYAKNELDEIENGLAEVLFSYKEIEEDLFGKNYYHGEILEKEHKKSLKNKPKEKKHKVCLVLSADKGLCGGYNSEINKGISNLIDDGYDLMVIGKRGLEYCKIHGANLIEETLYSMEELDYDRRAEICNKLIMLFQRKDVQSVEILYTAYINSLTFEVRREIILPFKEENWLRSGRKEIPKSEIEGAPALIIPYLVKELLNFRLRARTAEALICEHSSRRTAMKNASDNAKEMLDELKLTYNRARQAVITAEIIEIIAGSELGGKKHSVHDELNI